MSKAHRLKTRKTGAVRKTLPLNFLLGCSEADLSNFELARLAEVADLRRELHAILDSVVDAMSQAALAGWFKAQDRNSLRAALENDETALEWANRAIREGQRSEEELIPRTSLPPGAAHLAAAMRYQKRNVEEGKCAVCPKPLDPRSHRYCTKHLEAARLRYLSKQQRLEPGMIAWLYGADESEGRLRHPRQKMRRVSKAGKELLERVAKELGMSVAHVRQVALGDRQSEVVLRTLFTEFEKLPHSEKFLL